MNRIYPPVLALPLRYPYGDPALLSTERFSNSSSDRDGKPRCADRAFNGEGCPYPCELWFNREKFDEVGGCASRGERPKKLILK